MSRVCFVDRYPLEPEVVRRDLTLAPDHGIAGRCGFTPPNGRRS
jgi:hypothetical protein